MAFCSALQHTEVDIYSDKDQKKCSWLPAMFIKVAFVLLNRMDRLLEIKMHVKSYGFL